MCKMQTVSDALDMLTSHKCADFDLHYVFHCDAMEAMYRIPQRFSSLSNIDKSSAKEYAQRMIHRVSPALLHCEPSPALPADTGRACR